jgi:hypothetical protein
MAGFTSNVSCIVQNLMNFRPEVNKLIEIAPEIISIESKKGLLNVQIPNSFIGERPIKCRLLSAKRRNGMIGEQSTYEPSKYLIIHTHGGVRLNHRLLAYLAV